MIEINPLPGLVRVLLLSLALTACGAGDAGGQPGKKGSRTVTLYNVAADNAEMNAATARARASVGELLARLRQPPPGLSYLGVKVRLGNATRGEHIWLYDVHLEGDRIAGRLLDDAEHFPRYRQGDAIRVLPGQISDWMTVEDGHACGGFTVRVLQPRMSADEWREYLQVMKIQRLPPGNRLCDVEAR